MLSSAAGAEGGDGDDGDGEGAGGGGGGDGEADGGDGAVTVKLKDFSRLLTLPPSPDHLNSFPFMVTVHSDAPCAICTLK